MAAVVYRTNLNSKHDLSAPAMSLRVRLVGVNKHPHSECWLHWTAGRVRIQCQIDYWATLNSKQDLSAPSILIRVKLVGENNHPTQTAGDHWGQHGWWKLRFN